MNLMNISEQLKEIQKISVVNNLLEHGNKDALNNIINNMKAPLSIMVMGSFSTGKSTFINALVGQKVAAVSANPTTAVITKLCYGDKDRLKVFFRNNSTKDFSPEEFNKLTAVNENINANKIHEEIDYVERQLPINILKQVTIIDSPGLNDINEKHSLATERFVKSADSVLWMFSVVQACSNVELAAMGNLTSRLKPIAIVNKMDLIDEEEDDPQEFLDNVRQILKDKVQAVVGISAEYALQAKLEDNKGKEIIGNLGELEKVIVNLVLPHKETFKFNTFLDEFGTYLADVMTGIQNYYDENNISNSSFQRYEGKYSAFLRSLDNVGQNLKGLCEDEIRKNNPQAMFLMAVIYDFGIGVNKDLLKAKNLYEQAGIQNHILAQIKLMILYKNIGDLEKMIYWLERAASTGDADCNYWLGLCYLNGHGVDEDSYQAFKYFKLASAQGSVDAMYELGMCYLEGSGITKNEREAFKLLMQAYENGNCYASYELGNIYLNGKITTIDLNKAFTLYLSAAECGLPEAEYMVAKCYFDGKGTYKSESKAVEYLTRAANNEYPNAQFELAKYLLEHNS